MLDDALYRLRSEWSIDQAFVFGKREELHALLREVGKRRFNAAIDRTVKTHQGNFCPTTAQIRANVRTRSGDKNDRKFWRDPNCPKCHGVGWFYVSDYDADKVFNKSGHQAVLRCREPGCLQFDKE